MFSTCLKMLIRTSPSVLSMCVGCLLKLRLFYHFPNQPAEMANKNISRWSESTFQLTILTKEYFSCFSSLNNEIPKSTKVSRSRSKSRSNFCKCRSLYISNRSFVSKANTYCNYPSKPQSFLSASNRLLFMIKSDKKRNSSRIISCRHSSIISASSTSFIEIRDLDCSCISDSILARCYKNYGGGKRPASVYCC